MRMPPPGSPGYLAEAGFHDHQWVQPSELVVSQWVRAKCMFGCPDYGRNASCPPHVPGAGVPGIPAGILPGPLLIHLSCTESPRGGGGSGASRTRRLLIEAERRAPLGL